MKHLKFVLSFLLFMGLIGSVSAKKAKIELNLEKGTTYNLKVVMENNVDQKMMGKDISIKQDITMVSETEVADKLSNGNFLVKQTISDLDFTMVMNGKETNLESLTNNPLEAIKQMVLSYEVSKKGEVSNITGLENLAEKLGSNQQLSGVLKGVLNPEQLASFFSYLPKEPVDVGDSYEVKLNNADLMNMETTTQFTVTEITKDRVNLDINLAMDMESGQSFQQNGMDMKIKANGQQTGDFIVSRKDGMPISSTVLMDMNMEVSFKNPSNDETINMPMNMKMKSVTTVTKK